jgi:hypothetical protein
MSHRVQDDAARPPVATDAEVVEQVLHDDRDRRVPDRDQLDGDRR